MPKFFPLMGDAFHFQCLHYIYEKVGREVPSQCNQGQVSTFSISATDKRGQTYAFDKVALNRLSTLDFVADRLSLAHIAYRRLLTIAETSAEHFS